MYSDPGGRNVRDMRQWNPSARGEASLLWEGFGALLDGRVLWWMSVLVSMGRELGSGL